MSQYDQYDPGYFGPGQKSDSQVSHSTINRHDERYGRDRIRTVGYRAPGFDLGTLLWPILFGVLHFVIATIVQVGDLFIRLLVDSELRDLLRNPDILLDQLSLTDIMMQNFLMTAAIYSVIQIIVYALFLRSRQKKERHYVLNRKATPAHWASTIVIILGGMGLSTLWIMLLDFLARHFDFWQRTMQNYGQLTETLQSDNLWLMAITVTILVPIAEELLFRGIFMAEFRRVMPLWVAIALNGLLFALFHFNLVQSVYAFIVGMAIAACYVWTESIAVPIVMHIVYNFTGSIVPSLIGENQQAALIVGIVQIAFFVVAIFAAIHLYRTRRKPHAKPEPIETP